jgi:hypothetical protein
MATTSKKRTKRRRGQTRKVQNQSNNRLLTVGVAILVIGLLIFGTFQVFGNQTTTTTSVVQADSDSLESLSIADNQGQHAEVVPVTDRETRFLGPASDSATVTLAEAGQLGQPTLLWFHADW